jgi:hypothetical protein
MAENTVIAGMMHFSYNPTCQPAAFIANFATRDPGTQTTWGSLMRVTTPLPTKKESVFIQWPVRGLKVGVRVLQTLLVPFVLEGITSWDLTTLVLR